MLITEIVSPPPTEGHEEGGLLFSGAKEEKPLI